MRLPPVVFSDFGAALDEGTWLRDYVRWAARQTDAPLASHLIAGVAALATFAPRNMVFRPHIGAPVHAAFWGMVVGPSGLGRKSTVVGLGSGLIRDVDPNRLGSQPDSAEGLMEEMAQQPQLTLVYSEFGEFLAKTTRGSRQENVRTLETALWDGVTMSRRLARRTVVIDTPRLTLLGGVSDTYLERYTQDEDFTGGWISRFTFAAGRSEHEPDTTHDPVETDRQRQSLLVRLRRMAGRKVIGPSNLTDDAWRVWLPWLNKLTAQAKDVTTNPWLRGAVTRAHETALTVAMNNAHIEKRAKDTPWSLTEQDIVAGIAVAGVSLKSLTFIVNELSTSLYQRRRRELVERLRTRPYSLRAISRHFKIRKRELDDLIASVEAEGILGTFENANGTTFYTLRDLDAVLAEEGEAVKPPPLPQDMLGGTVVSLDAARVARNHEESTQLGTEPVPAPPDDFYDYEDPMREASEE